MALHISDAEAYAMALNGSMAFTVCHYGPLKVEIFMETSL